MKVLLSPLNTFGKWDYYLLNGICLAKVRLWKRQQSSEIVPNFHFKCKCPTKHHAKGLFVEKSKGEVIKTLLDGVDLR